MVTPIVVMMLNSITTPLATSMISDNDMINNRAVGYGEEYCQDSVPDSCP